MSPYVGISVFSQALVIKPVHLRYLSALMISSENGYAIPVSQFQSDEKGDCLYGVVPTVNVVAHEKIISVWRIAANTKEFRKVMLCQV